MKKHKIIWLALIALVIGVGSLYMFSQGNLFLDSKAGLRITKEKQLDYLKSQEEEIKKIVKSQNAKIESVEINWEETNWEEVDNGTPQGGGEIVNVYGRFNHIENSSWNVTFLVKDNEVVPNSMSLANDLYVGGRIFE
jgi:hypothetical protein